MNAKRGDIIRWEALGAFQYGIITSRQPFENPNGFSWVKAKKSLQDRQEYTIYLNPETVKVESPVR